jgi:hypothetical protein
MPRSGTSQSRAHFSVIHFSVIGVPRSGLRERWWAENDRAPPLFCVADPSPRKGLDDWSERAYKGLTNATPTLSRSEVMEKFRSRATPAELQEFERLSAAGDLSSESRAMELVLFKLTDKELFQIGITEVGQPDRLEWGLAWCRGFTDSGRSFEQTLASVGVSAGGVYGHGYSGWYVPREQFFAARRALLAATNLHGIEFTITEPKFGLR